MKQLPLENDQLFEKIYSINTKISEYEREIEKQNNNMLIRKAKEAPLLKNMF